jgi:hypothetical protein
MLILEAKWSGKAGGATADNRLAYSCLHAHLLCGFSIQVLLHSCASHLLPLAYIPQNYALIPHHPQLHTCVCAAPARRILGMVDGAVLLVDAVEGPLAQTKFVLAKALSRGLAPIVVLNKVDRPAATQARCDAVASQLFDLFASLGADDRQLDFPILYASSKQVITCAANNRKHRG